LNFLRRIWQMVKTSLNISINIEKSWCTSHRISKPGRRKRQVWSGRRLNFLRRICQMVKTSLNISVNIEKS